MHFVNIRRVGWICLSFGIQSSRLAACLRCPSYQGPRSAACSFHQVVSSSGIGSTRAVEHPSTATSESEWISLRTSRALSPSAPSNPSKHAFLGEGVIGASSFARPTTAETLRQAQGVWGAEDPALHSPDLGLGVKSAATTAATRRTRQRRASRAENQTDTDGSCLFYLFPPGLKLVVNWNESPHEGCGKPYRRQHGRNAVRTAKRRRCELSKEGSRSTSKRKKGWGGIYLRNEANGFRGYHRVDDGE